MIEYVDFRPTLPTIELRYARTCQISNIPIEKIIR